MPARSLSMVPVRGGGSLDTPEPPEYGLPGSICPRGPEDGSDEDERSSNGSSRTACTRGSLTISTDCSYQGIHSEPTEDEPWIVRALDAAATDENGAGTFGLMTGNWGNIQKRDRRAHRNRDLLSEPSHLLALQEADMHLQGMPSSPSQRQDNLGRIAGHVATSPL